MFICRITGKTSKPGEKCFKAVIKSRPRVYTQKFFNEDTNEYEDVEVATGWEIVKEVNATEEGYNLWNSLSPEEKSTFQLI